MWCPSCHMSFLKVGASRAESGQKGRRASSKAVGGEGEGRGEKAAARFVAWCCHQFQVSGEQGCRVCWRGLSGRRCRHSGATAACRAKALDYFDFESRCSQLGGEGRKCWPEANLCEPANGSLSGRLPVHRSCSRSGGPVGSKPALVHVATV